MFSLFIMINKLYSIIHIHKLFIRIFTRNLLYNKNRNVTLIAYLILAFLLSILIATSYYVINTIPKHLFDINILFFFFSFSLTDLFVKGLLSKNICNSSYLQLKSIGLTQSNSATLIIYSVNFSLPQLLSLCLLLPIAVLLFTASTNLFLAISLSFNLLLAFFTNNYIILLFDILLFKTIFTRRLLLPAFIIITGSILLSLPSTRDFIFSNSYSRIFILNIILLLITLYITHNLLKKYIYLFGEDYNQKNINSSTIRFSSIRTIYQIIILIDLIAIFRNKRIRSMYLSNLILLVYLIYLALSTTTNDEPSKLKLFTLYFSTFIFTAQYGQFIFFWQSDYQNFLNTCKISITDLIRARRLLYYLLLILSCCISTALTLIVKGGILVLASSVFFQIGIGLPLFFVISLFFGTTISLNQNSFFNLNGFNSKLYFLNLLVFSIPILLFILITTFFNSNTALYTLIFTGTLGILFQFIYNSQFIAFFENRNKLVSVSKNDIDAYKD